MRLQTAKRTVGVLLVAAVALFIDQLTKLLAQYFLAGGTAVPIIPKWVWLSYTENDAIAFGFGSGNRPFMIAVMAVTAVLMIVIPAVAVTAFKRNRAARIALAFIEGGAIGNFIDRLAVYNAEGVGVVRDFVNLQRFGFAVCNVADFFITFGAVALVIIILFIGPQAVIPLKKSWREQAKAEEAERERKKNAKS